MEEDINVHNFSFDLINLRKTEGGVNLYTLGNKLNQLAS